MNIIDIHAASFPAFGLPAPTSIILSVLVKRVEGTVKAYAGIVPDNSRKDPNYKAVRDMVAARGNPLKYREAVIIWPSLKPEEYAG